MWPRGVPSSLEQELLGREKERSGGGRVPRGAPGVAQGGRAGGGRSPTGGSQASAGLRLPALPAPVCFSYFRGGLEKSATP